ncbi:MAG: PilW family protein [Granulosicoccus sp.]
MVKPPHIRNGFTLIELMVAITVGLFMSLVMVGYFTKAMRSAAVLRSENRIVISAQNAQSLLIQAAREAGSGNIVNSDVPFYIGDCGSWSPCTSNGAGTNSDRIAVLLYPENQKTCGNTSVDEGEQIANVYYQALQSGIGALFCRGFSLETMTWIESPIILSKGVENLQILYRVNDTDSATYKIVNANNVSAVGGNIELGWDRVRAVHFSILISDGLGSATPQTPRTQSFNLADTATQTFTDGILRRAYSSQAVVFSKMGQ